MYMYYLLIYTSTHSLPSLTSTLKKREDKVWAIVEGEHIPEWSDEEGEEGEEEEEVRMTPPPPSPNRTPGRKGAHHRGRDQR